MRLQWSFLIFTFVALFNELRSTKSGQFRSDFETQLKNAVTYAEFISILNISQSIDFQAEGISQDVHPKCVKAQPCQLVSRCVPVEIPNEPNVYVFPQCVQLFKCHREGCCDPGKRCRGKSEWVPIKVALFRIDNPPDAIQLPGRTLYMKNHTKCSLASIKQQIHKYTKPTPAYKQVVMQSDISQERVCPDDSNMCNENNRQTQEECAANGFTYNADCCSCE